MTNKIDAKRREQILASRKKSSAIDAMLRVDHAGEYGATRIYAGQAAILAADIETSREIQHMQEQEKIHFRYFDQALQNRKIRPTIFQPLWCVAGFALGAVTAAIGKKAAMACTVAVETVIDQHYQEQRENISADEKDLAQMVEKFRLEELEHRDLALASDAQSAPGYFCLSAVIQLFSRAAIYISARY
jgi:ubiquinone biosynthesis monooxygenase Coq7